MRKIVRTMLTVVTSAFVALQMGALPAFAQENTGNGLRIVPPRQELSIERGESRTFNVQITNLSDEAVVVKTFVNDFESDGSSGEPIIITDETIRTDRTIADFLVGLDDIQMNGNEEKNIEVTLDVPESAPAGAYFGLLRFQSVPLAIAESDAPVQFSLNSSIGVLVLADIPGDTTTAAELESIDFQIVNTDENGNIDGVPNVGSVFTEVPNQVALTVKNTGDTFVKPFGDVTIKGWFGDDVSYKINDISPQGNVLPSSSRVFTDDVELSGFGRYTAEINIAFEQGSEVQTITRTFWVIPVWVYIVLAAFVALLGLGGFVIYRKVTA